MHAISINDYRYVVLLLCEYQKNTNTYLLTGISFFLLMIVKNEILITH